MNISGHTVLVTGGATGLGLAISKQFYTAGNRIILVGRREKTLLAAASDMPGAITKVADVAKPSDRERLVTEFPDITVLVNNAAISQLGVFADFTPLQIEYELNVNLLAPVLLTRAFLPTLLQKQQAAVVNITSGLALVPAESAPIYCSSKAALRSFSKCLRWQLEKTPVRVFEVLPPLIGTDMTRGHGQPTMTIPAFVNEFWRGYRSDKQEMLIGKVKAFRFLERLFPRLMERQVRHLLS